MSKELEITSWPCHKEKGAVLIGTGIDSNVYKIGEFVVKNYKLQIEDGAVTGLNLGILNDYFQVTNLAQKYLENYPIFLESIHSGKHYPLVINPFLELHKCGLCGGIEGVCKYVPGRKLEDIHRKIGLVDLDDELAGISRKLGDGLGVNGIHITETNIKVTNSGLAVVTDLCSQISVLFVFNRKLT